MRRKKKDRPAPPAPSTDRAPVSPAVLGAPVSRWRLAAVVALLCLAVAAGYAPALHGGFIWDDTVLLSESPLVHADDGLRRFWLTTEAPDYWPLTNTTFWVEWRLWGEDTTGYHVTNLALHIVESLLVWAVLARLGMGLWGAALAGFLFAVHPVNVESVAWIAQRKNLVALLFFLLSVLFYLRSEDSRAGETATGPRAERWYWASLAAFVLAMLGKGSAAPLPAVLLLIVWWRRRRLARLDVLRVAPFVVVAVSLVLVNVWFQTHGTGPIRPTGVLERLLGAGGVVWFYLSKAVAPLGLSFVYPAWDVRADRLGWWIPSAAVVLVSAALWARRDGAARPFFATWTYYLLALVPVMGLTDVYFMTFSPVADHYQHAALIGVVALAGAGWETWHGRARGVGKGVAVAVAAVVVASLTWLTARQSALYRDAETLYRATIAANPGCWLCQYNLAVDLGTRGRGEEAFAHLQEAVRIKPDYAEAHNNLSLALAGRGRYDEALHHAREAVRIRPDLPEALVNLGILLSRSGRPEEAVVHLRRAVELRPGSGEAHHNLGLALLAAGRPGEAVPPLEEAIRLDPASADTGLPSVALALARSGRPQEAISRYEEVLRTRPDDAQARYNLALLLAGAGRTGEAIAHLGAALNARPDYADAHNNLAVLLAGAGRLADAIPHFREAARIRPDFVPARLNLAETCARAGRFAEAAAEARAALPLLAPGERPALERRIAAWTALSGR